MYSKFFNVAENAKRIYSLEFPHLNVIFIFLLTRTMTGPKVTQVHMFL